MTPLTFFLSLMLPTHGFECIYTVNNGAGPPYELNLTSVSEWTLQLSLSAEATYYYTPCRNGIQCRQGNADFANNVAQYIPAANQCDHYLSVDDKQSPTYSHASASFVFQYENGEFCAVTQQPRRTTIYWTCAENGPVAYMERVQEMQTCDYHITIESKLACIPENTRNANCQYIVGESATLNLAPLRVINPLRFDGNNGYRIYYSPCQNGLNCFQQSGSRKVMSSLDNTATGTCERYIANWENGNHKPSYSAAHGGTFEFVYYNGEPCNGGAVGSEERITYICNETVDTAQTINVTVLESCRIDYFVASSLACAASYDSNGNLKGF